MTDITIGMNKVDDEDLHCNKCGGKKVYIRGKHPGMDNQIVCPTCLSETLDDVRSRLRIYYGVAYKDG